MAVEARDEKYRRLLDMSTWVEVGAFTGAAFGAATLFVVAIIVWYTLGAPAEPGFSEEKSTFLLFMLPLVGLFCGAAAGVLIAVGTGAFRNKPKVRKIVEQTTTLKKGA